MDNCWKHVDLVVCKYRHAMSSLTSSVVSSADNQLNWIPYKQSLTITMLAIDMIYAMRVTFNALSCKMGIINSYALKLALVFRLQINSWFVSQPDASGSRVPRRLSLHFL